MTTAAASGAPDIRSNFVVHRVVADEADPRSGRVQWSPVKSLWLTGMTAAALVGGTLAFSWDALSLFLVTCAITLCGGHSLGMHRRLIHNSYECPRWLEYLLVYLGVLVGMAGPYGMIRTHDMRDWAQRNPRCHDYFAHRRPFLQDGWWQLHCELKLDRPPAFKLEDRIATDPVYRFMESTLMWQQLPWALLFFALGGWGWVFWGVCARVAVCVTGHWLVGYFAHNSGPRDWHVEGAGVQGYNVRFCGLLTMGEAWHNNHHAFPGSARLGLYEGQADPGWWVLMALKRVGLAWNIKTPADLASRPQLRPLGAAAPARPWLPGSAMQLPSEYGRG
jgi:stearoyl-CoA desaturase (delta-9 desaturase)